MKKTRYAGPRVALQIEINRAHGRALLEGVSDYAQEHTDWRLELVDPKSLRDVAKVRKYDGLIVRVMDDDAAKALVKSGRPVVDTYSRIDESAIPSIRLDDAKIAEMAFKCLSGRHYQTFAYCGFPGVRFSDARGSVFSACARTIGAKVFCYTGKSQVTDAFFRDEKIGVADAVALEKWLVSLPRPVAMFCCNDLRAVQVLNRCADLGLRVPEDVAVLGVDNDVLLCTFANPSLSSVMTDPFALGRRAAQMLHEQMSGKGAGNRRSAGSVEPCLWTPKKVVERMSTDAYPFKTPWLVDAVRYIRRNLPNGVSASEVVAFVGYSHPKVNKVFSLELGHTVKREIQLQRSRMACDLLLDTDCPIGEIAVRCGYQRAPYFISCFSEEFGMTPEVWRKRRRFQKV